MEKKITILQNPTFNFRYKTSTSVGYIHQNNKKFMDDSNFPNGVCKQCHEPVMVLIRKKELQEGDIRYECKKCGHISKK